MKIVETSVKADGYGAAENKISDVIFSDTSFMYEQTYWVIYAGAGLLLGSFFLMLGYLF